ncbi:MAG: hypothetical protein IH892_12835 [Planctomycetes bacterium]|nr:hypothetical protein [Planctomycetota bacterium]
MLKKSLIAIAVLAIALPAIADFHVDRDPKDHFTNIKVHDWPTSFSKVTVTTIDVCLDVGYFIQILDTDCIKVTQDTGASNPYKTYVGCLLTDIESNFDATLSAKITSKGNSVAKGEWKVKLDGGSSVNIPAGDSDVEICVTGKKVNINKLHGGDSDVVVAEVTLQVVPQGST